jgi:hypothetical protein
VRAEADRASQAQDTPTNGTKYFPILLNSPTSRSDLSNSGDITFWREGLYVFDSNTKRFSQLADFPGGPQLGQTENDLNSSGQIVLTAGTDIYLATPRPYGDYDNDGDVDGGDLAAWEAAYGSAVAIGTAADGNSDREVSGDDFLLWQRQVGLDAGPLSNSAWEVPEPMSSVLLIGMVISVLGRRYY